MSRFAPAVVPPSEISLPAYWFVFHQSQILVYPTDNDNEIPRWLDFAESGLIPFRQHYLGTFDKIPCYAVEVKSIESLSKSDMMWMPLRAAITDLPYEFFVLAGCAAQILRWDSDYQFCGRCGTKMVIHARERAKQCRHCKVFYYPQLAPAIIVLIYRGQQILLSRSPHFKVGMYSVQAGFVEVGESLEETVVREIREEVGLEIKNLRYFGSQPWPFPHSLMIAFTAEYASGELMIDPKELDDAGWYDIHHLPLLPAPSSIARHLIEWFVNSIKSLES